MENKRQNLDSDRQNHIAKKQRSIASFFGGSSTLNLSPVTNKEKKQSKKMFNRNIYIHK